MEKSPSIYSILLVVSKPKIDNYENQQAWNTYVKQLKDVSMQNKDIELLSENVLLILLNNNLNAISQVVSRMDNLSYKYIIFDEEIKWHEVSRA